ncbi:MAG: hypothetical protein ACR2P6_04280 [Gammaproteobacteria bacterium]
MENSTNSTIEPFPGSPAARIYHTAGHYGLQADTTALFAECVDNLGYILAACPAHAAPAAAKSALRGYLCDPELLHPTHLQGASDNYTRHLLYAHPEGAFSIMAIVWMPGNATPIHGHTAWGTVGVYAGNPSVDLFETAHASSGAMHLQKKMTLKLKQNDLSTVQPGIDDLHRIYNTTTQRAVTIHIYGRDLLHNPAALNISFPH